MEIQRLQVVVTERDIHDLVHKHLPDDVAVEDLAIAIQPDGLLVKGVYPAFVPVSFQALWELGVDQGKATAKLVNFRTMGMPGNVLKSLIMNVIADAAKKEKWLKVQGDVVQADVDALLQKQGLTILTRLTAIRCQAGRLTLEGGLGEPPT